MGAVMAMFSLWYVSIVEMIDAVFHAEMTDE